MDTQPKPAPEPQLATPPDEKPAASPAPTSPAASKEPALPPMPANLKTVEPEPVPAPDEKPNTAQPTVTHLKPTETPAANPITKKPIFVIVVSMVCFVLLCAIAYAAYSQSK